MTKDPSTEPNYSWFYVAYIAFIVGLMWLLMSCSTTQPAHLNYAKKLPKSKKQNVSWVQKTKINAIKKTFKY